MLSNLAIINRLLQPNIELAFGDIKAVSQIIHRGRFFEMQENDRQNRFID